MLPLTLKEPSLLRGMSAKWIKILQWMIPRGTFDVDDLTVAQCLSREDARSQMHHLKKRGLIETVGCKKYRITDAGIDAALDH